jgi:hypothetical protein
MRNLNLSKIIGYLLVSPVVIYCVFILLLFLSAGFGLIEIKKFRVLIGAYLINTNSSLLNLGLFALAGAYLIKKKDQN